MDEFFRIFRRYPADCQPTRVEPLASAGGLSGAAFWRIAAPRGDLVLRRWPMEHPTPEHLQFVHAVLRHAADHGTKILPVPIATTDGATFVRHDGHLWELAPWLPGAADYEQNPHVEKLRAAMRALAEFHLAVADFPIGPPLASSRGPAPAVNHRLVRLRELKVGGIETLTHAITDKTWPDFVPLARRFAAELPRAVPLAIARLAPLVDVPLPQQPCIRDVWHDHVLFDGDTVTGLIDFGAMQTDTPATDVARLLGSLVGDDANGWRKGLAAYTAVRPLSDQESLAVFALDKAGTILAGCNWLRWIYVEGRQFDNPSKIAARFARSLQRTEALR
jgi:homoserine kinase type II